MRGVSAIDAEGQPFHDPQADRVLFGSLRTHLDARIRIVEVDAHINDPAFAEVMSREMLDLLRTRQHG
jgi:uncharacterized protein (UPF0261 family)